MTPITVQNLLTIMLFACILDYKRAPLGLKAATLQLLTTALTLSSAALWFTLIVIAVLTALTTFTVVLSLITISIILIQLILFSLFATKITKSVTVSIIVYAIGIDA